MQNQIIEIENISKLYRLGNVGTGTISHDLNRWWAKIRGKEDPSQTIATINDRTQKTSSPFVWAIKDISFSVSPGDVFGIIGKNGAGKSTLLKILSRVTSPTKGVIKSKGRIASILEVGTGFHPELTGRENIFLNGAILGMTKNEIKSKLDEIVDFSGCAKYLDTPVKRYSSGMTVRLAFAVAANLESEILILDEVLAVGDSEFQKKCLGKMGDVATKEGRTVLFVSHNMAAVKSLCNKGVFLENGTVKVNGSINEAIETYSISGPQNNKMFESNGLVLKKFNISSQNSSYGIYSGDPVTLTGEIEGNIDNALPFLIFSLTNELGERLVLLSSRLNGVKIQQFNERLQFKIDVESLMIMPGTYYLNLLINNNGFPIATWEKFQKIEIENDPNAIALSLPSVSDRGIVYTRSHWSVVCE